jgi:hypothetical protein
LQRRLDTGLESGLETGCKGAGNGL